MALYVRDAWLAATNRGAAASRHPIEPADGAGSQMIEAGASEADALMAWDLVYPPRRLARRIGRSGGDLDEGGAR